MSVLCRDTVMLTRNCTMIHLGTLLDNYGPNLLSKMIPSVYTFYYIPKTETKIVSNARKRNIENGRPLHHINKSNGYLKSKYKKLALRRALVCEFSEIETCTPTLKFTNSVRLIQCIMRRLYTKRHNSAIIIQKYARRYIVNVCKMKALAMIKYGINFEHDSITLEALTDPCIILSDFLTGNRIFYNRSTIKKMQKIEEIPIFTYFNTLTQREENFYNYVVHDIYISPYTRREFTKDEIISVKNDMTFRFGQGITLFQNRKNNDKTV